MGQGQNPIDNFSAMKKMTNADELDQLDSHHRFPLTDKVIDGSALVSFIDQEGDCCAHFFLRDVSMDYEHCLCLFVRQHKPQFHNLGLSRTLAARYAKETPNIAELRYTGNRHAFSGLPFESYVVLVDDLKQSITVYVRYGRPDQDQMKELKIEDIA